MQNKHCPSKAFTLIELLVVVAIIALLISILLPSLTRAKESAAAVVCGNRHRSAYSGWAFYANDFNGKWIATWDTSRIYPWAIQSAPNLSLQSPYTMWYYVQGESIPGPAANTQAVTSGSPWWNHRSGRYGGFSLLNNGDLQPEDCLQYHCPDIQDKMNLSEYKTVFNWYLFSMTQFNPQFYNAQANRYETDMDRYPKTDLFTQPGNTGLLVCLAGDYDDSMYEAWCGPTMRNSDPHSGKSNYTFADGHVNLLAADETNALMWQPTRQKGGED